MITQLIDKVLIAHQFENEHTSENTRFYKRETGEALRFAILHEFNKLLTPKKINEVITSLIPDNFLDHPAFKRNCDLICIYRLDKLIDVKKYEEQIFAIEEDPHFFKKTVLYYSDDEVKALENCSFENLKEIIAEKSLFNAYKKAPLAATKYSIAARIFIKLPFLELPANLSELVPLRIQIEKEVKESGLTETYENFQKYSNMIDAYNLTDDSINNDDLSREMINDELENIQN